MSEEAKRNWKAQRIADRAEAANYWGYGYKRLDRGGE